MGSKERPKNEAGHSALVSGSFNNQGNLLTRLVLVGCKMSSSPPPTHLILKSLYRGLTGVQGLSRVYHPGGLNNTLLSQDYVVEVAPAMGTLGGVYIPRTRERVRSF